MFASESLTFTGSPTLRPETSAAFSVLLIEDSATIRGLLREALFVPDTIRLDNLLKQFRTKRQHLAIVLDEYGGTAGLVTLDDLMEQIVGEVQDLSPDGRGFQAPDWVPRRA